MSLQEKLSLPKDKKRMRIQEFIPEKYSGEIKEGEIIWKSPSNIALVKYWGKKAGQIPANPSISFTLDSCRTTTKLTFKKKQSFTDTFDFELFFENEQKGSFKPKIELFFERTEVYLPFLKEYTFEIHTSNTFPHSSGIASSASGMSALALCLMSMEEMLGPVMSKEFFYRKASFLARLGSGSACRSIQGPLVVWGEHAGTSGSSNLFGIKYPFEIHPNFTNYQDTILLVDKGEKQVSSSLGHSLMNSHPFAEQRFIQAHHNLDRLLEVFRTGDLDVFIRIVESEALTLHAMMMTSEPYFLLMKPNTLSIINKIFDFRKKTALHLCFTLDAGANVHLLYPENEQREILSFIKAELAAFCENGQFICDRTGTGAEKVSVDVH